MSDVPARRAFLLVDHGSRRAEANAVIEHVAELLRERVDGPVRIAHLELEPPDVAGGIAACVEAGAREIVLLPWFLGPGRHSQRDIPEQARAAAARHPGLSVRMAAPLGSDAALVEVLLRRADAAEPLGS